MVMRVFVVFHLSLATLTYEKHKYMFLTGYLFFWGGESFSIGIQIAGELSSCASLTTHVEMHGVFTEGPPTHTHTSCGEETSASYYTAAGRINTASNRAAGG